MSSAAPLPRPHADASAALVLADGSVFKGQGIGARGLAVGEVCFNTAMTGYQEILSDPSYAGQIITFTFPHIGNVGANGEDRESINPAARGLILRAPITQSSNWRAAEGLDAWLERAGLVGIAGLDTRALTRRIRDLGAPNGAVLHAPEGLDLDRAAAAARGFPGLEGLDLAKDVSCTQAYRWTAGGWNWGEGFAEAKAPRFHVVAVDYGVKHNILRSLVDVGCRVTVLPAQSSAAEVLRQAPDGVFLSNGPGDPAATGRYAVPTIRGVIDAGVPLFGICLGHQMLALALGARTAKMHLGHRGANHPVKDLDTGKVEITSQNHGFAVVPDSIPAGVTVTHRSLFDGSIEGLRVEGKPVFSVQYHPEASPGPKDSAYLFRRFAALMERRHA
ncbi:MAG: glutamine-hydrolyzing carbamoyl-phosphate synthase small subunit [Alphaproteobacteria bacterium]|nr:glutamine-hydrolyzing carbamoyl-phosphate synthase small subunit [Alphaproteobacteria bacterium]